MAKAGRPDNYTKLVEPHLDEIGLMALQMSEGDIAKTLGISLSSFKIYKVKHPELAKALQSGRRELVMELRSTMIQKAKGFQYEEVKEIYDETGTLIRKEVTHKAALPDLGSMHLLLKNYDPENWTNDPQVIALRKAELKLQEMKLEQGKWD